MTFQGAVQLFRNGNNTGVNKLTVNNNLTFSGGFIAPGDTTTQTTPGLVVNGTGTLTLSASSASFAPHMYLSVPLTVDTATVVFNGVNDGDSSVPNPVLSGTTHGAPVDGSGANIGSITLQNNGTLKLGMANAFPGGGPTPTPPNIVFSSGGGTLNSNGLAQTFGTLTVTGAAAAIDLGAAASPTTLKFASSSGSFGGLLTIANWNYGTDHLNLSSATGLSVQQLSQIKFADFHQGAFDCHRFNKPSRG